MRILRTDSTHQDFRRLVQQLDAYLAEIDGKDHPYYAKFNTIDSLKHVVVVYENDMPVGCGAMKQHAVDTVEIKRMYTTPESRGKGVATGVLRELETWAAELSYKRCILETGKRQKEAVSLYTRSGYNIIPNYGQYAGMDNSVCFERRLK
ncbi:MAG TPA: GNAT family N-acetyltransferase [Bacteroidota bacterium]|nr:GNAT family N-acetyltransferase [Bacteroidota bacterium]